MSAKAGGRASRTAKHHDQPLKYVRFDGLRKAAEFSLQETVNKLTLDKLVECYPEVDRATLADFQQQITDMWTSKALDEFQGIYEEKDLEQRLNELDEIVYESQQRQTRKDAAFEIHRLAPHEIVENRLINLKQRSIDVLATKLASLKSENSALVSQIKQLHNESVDNFRSVETSIGQLESLDQMRDQLSDERFEQLLKYITEKCF
ncbi:hypothetical protein OGAPHI_001615 [Ogataea philodendri]|uniref:Kinetochore-associated protein NNF1 n=1 Tax=Ogataea philodendri TaxID=1378263 RepID=A0A9P8PDX2_9ASCO|nr:uncharacterized protein OGAPHI_001615 [Ogataea philodendri]KAH3669494.1 hypothetical protein OGAPHI_001615 [Ogataea philodendri]